MESFELWPSGKGTATNKQIEYFLNLGGVVNCGTRSDKSQLRARACKYDMSEAISLLKAGIDVEFNL